MNILISIVILIVLGLSSCASSNVKSSTHHNWKHVNTGRTCKK